MALEIVFWVAVGLIVYAHLGYPLLLRALVGFFGERRFGPLSAGDELHRVSLIVPAHDEEAVIERKVANALALDYPAGTARGDRRLGRLVRPHRRAGPLGRRRSGARPSARRQGRRPQRRRPAGDGRDPRLLRRQQLLAPRCPRAGWSAASPTSGSATPAARSASRGARAETRRASTGATRWAFAPWRPGWPGSPPATAGSTRCAGRPTSSSTRAAARTSAFPSS